jgi:hypothetical protein
MSHMASGINEMTKRVHEQLNAEMPLRRYFLFVGGALLTLILAANWLLPAPASNQLTTSRVRLPPIRIHSALKGPDAVVIDTSKSSIGPMPAQEAVVASQAPAPPASTPDQTPAHPNAEASAAANAPAAAEGPRQNSGKIRTAGLTPAPIRGSSMHVEPDRTTLPSVFKFRETFAQAVSPSAKQLRQRETTAGRRIGFHLQGRPGLSNR